ncbi:MAG: LuxR C-terminal-related transcriptional regulator [Phycisphaerales bacterium]|nr:LuxR C-terminal-related transcriptional regulator [Phycisphaerales bacterium]
MLTDSEWAMVAKQFRLSPRELEVTRGIFAGRKFGIVALELKISLHTLHTHWRRVKQKLRIESRIEAIHRIYNERDHHRDAEVRDHRSEVSGVERDDGLVEPHAGIVERHGALVRANDDRGGGNAALVRLNGAGGRANAAGVRGNAAIVGRNDAVVA